MDVIDLSSSPEPINRPKRKRSKTHAEVIEIMSDDEHASLVEQNQITAGREAAVQGRSAMNQPEEERQLRDATHHHNPQIPLFYSSDDVDPPPTFTRSRPATPPPAPHAAPIDPIDTYVASIIEVVPDVQPAHAFELVERLMQSQPEHAVELALHAIFEDPSYPKIDRKGKRKRDPDEDEQGPSHANLKPKVDYLSVDRAFDGGPYYFDLSMVGFPMASRTRETRLICHPVGTTHG